MEVLFKNRTHISATRKILIHFIGVIAFILVTEYILQWLPKYLQIAIINQYLESLLTIGPRKIMISTNTCYRHITKEGDSPFSAPHTSFSPSIGNPYIQLTYTHTYTHTYALTHAHTHRERSVLRFILYIYIYIYNLNNHTIVVFTNGYSKMSSDICNLIYSFYPKHFLPFIVIVNTLQLEYSTLLYINKTTNVIDTHSYIHAIMNIREEEIWI